MRRALLRAAAALLAASCCATAGPVLATELYIEDFTTAAFEDTAATTAFWDVTEGVLTLPPFEVTEVGSCASSGPCRSATHHGDYVFLFASGGGIDVIDISDVTAPSIVATYNSIGYSYQGVVAGDCLYVADDTGGLAIVDITDPTSPSTIVAYSTPGKARGVAVAGNTAFVADNTGGFFSLDVTDPSSPLLLQTITPAGQPQDVELAGDVAYVASWDAGVHAVDVTDPTSMSVIGTYDTPGGAVAVNVQGDVLYVADHSGGFLALDISDPTSPSLLSSTSTPDDAQTVSVSGDHAYVPCDGAGVLVFDVTDPALPALVTTHDTPGHAFHLDLAGEHAFLADRDGGFQILQVCGLDALNEPEGALSWEYGAEGLAVRGDHAFTVRADEGLTILSIEDPADPVIVGTADLHGPQSNCEALAIHGDIVYTGTQDWINIFDISDPSNPVLADTVEVTHPGPSLVFGIFDLAVDGDWMVVGGGGLETTDQILEVFDISDPLDPISVAIVPGPGFVDRVHLDGDWLYVTEGWAWELYDFSDPTTPTHVGYLPGTRGQGLDLDGGIAFATYDDFDRTEEIKFIDRVDPAAPVTLGSYDVQDGWSYDGPVWNVLVDGDVMFLTTERIERADVSDMVAPQFIDFIGEADDEHYVRAALAGDHMFLTFTGEMYLADGGFQVERIYQRAYDVDGTLVQSLDVEPSGETVTAARLAAEYTGEMTWWLSADGGANWQEVDPRGRWHELAHPGDELLWRAELSYVDGVAPECTSVTVEWGEPVGVDDNEIPTRFALRQNTPNPFNPVTTIAYDVPASGGHVTITIYDVSGRRVRTLVDSPQEPGSLAAVWDGTDETGERVGSGIYYCRMRAGEFEQTTNLTLLK